MTRVLLTRHGETDWNVQRRIQGWIDIPLNEAGRWQAQALARRIHAEYKVDAVYSSDLLRARQTAQEIADLFDQDVVEEKDLREKNFGVLQGLTLEQVATDHPEFLEENKYLGAIEDGESGVDVDARIRRVMARIMTKEQGKTVVVVAHGGCLRCALAYLLGETFVEFMQKVESGIREYRSQNTPLFLFERDSSGWKNLLWSDVEHLTR